MRVFGMITTKASYRYTDYAISSFIENTPLRPFDKFVLIDNDQSYGELERSFSITPQKIINKEPKSFAENVNEVMSIAFSNKADLFFLNNDLIFTPNWLDPLLIPEISILSPFSNREIQYEDNGFKWTNALSLEEYLGKEKDLLKITTQHFLNTRGFQTVISLPFFCIKIPYFVYSELGPLDERFGKGGAEDYDYCLRAGLAGIPVRYAAQSYILHFSGKSTWSGAESVEEEKKRKENFSKEFRDKWGDNLKRILIDEENNLIDELPGAKEYISKGDLKGFIEHCRA